MERVRRIPASILTLLLLLPCLAAGVPSEIDLRATILEIQNICFSLYPPELLRRMSGRPGPPPEEVRLNPPLQMKYLSSEEKAEKGLFYPSLLGDYLPAFTAEVRPGRRFLDLGSGDGRVVFLAAVLGADATGIEYDHPLHDIALEARRRLRRIVPAGRVTLRQGDFFEEDVSRYDVIFYFGDGTYLQDRMLAKLGREMRPGATLLLAHMPDDPEGFDPVARYGVVRSYRRGVPREP
jgi:SAM-dependent methyltransferase